LGDIAEEDEEELEQKWQELQLKESQVSIFLTFVLKIVKDF
jgi:hypothetical protein